MLKKPKIFITGGHLTPAIAVIELLIKENWQVWYIGRKYAQEEDVSVSVEYETIKKLDNKIRFLQITAGKLQRYLNFKTIMSLFKIPVGFFQSFIWILSIRPDIILSFGGYVAIPVTIVAYILRIPIVTHEQTHTPGLANKIIAKFANKVCLTWKDSSKYYKGNVSIIGTPLRKSILKVDLNFSINLNKPLIYISGGSLGSHKLNLLFEPILIKLLKSFSVIHQCGKTIKFRDYPRLLDFKKNLPADLYNNYLPVKYIEKEYLGWVYRHIAFFIGRSGANTVYELSALGIPSIFIPLPFAQKNEQWENARLYEDNKAGLILSQNKLDSRKLYNTIKSFYQNILSYKKMAQKLPTRIKFNAAESLISILKSTLKN